MTIFDAYNSTQITSEISVIRIDFYLMNIIIKIAPTLRAMSRQLPRHVRLLLFWVLLVEAEVVSAQPVVDSVPWCPANTSPCGEDEASLCCNRGDHCVNGVCRCAGVTCGTTCCLSGEVCLASKTCCSHPCGTSCLAPYQVCALGRPYQPYDVISPRIDVNGFWLNPNWAWEVSAGTEAWSQNPKNFCGHLGEWPCTNTMHPAWVKPPWLNVSGYCLGSCRIYDAAHRGEDCPANCAVGGTDVPSGIISGCLGQTGHINWGVATLQGQLVYHDQTSCATDCDHNFDMLVTARRDGAQVDAHRHLEFRANETTSRYDGTRLPWWNHFNKASDEERFRMVGGYVGIAIGIFSIDAAHTWLPTELHPVYAMAIDQPQLFPASPGDDVWEVFFHRALSQGYCGRDTVVLIPKTVQMALPWRENATSVAHDSAADKTDATPNSLYAVTVNSAAKTVILTMVLDDSPATGSSDPYFVGEIHLKWNAPYTGALLKRPANREAEHPDIESVTAKQIARLPEAKRARLQQNLDRLEKIYSSRAQKTAPKTGSAKLVPISQIAVPPPNDPTSAVYMIPHDEVKDQARLDAIRDALGKDTPPLFHPKSKTPSAPAK